MNIILISDIHATNRIPRGRFGDPLEDFHDKMKFIFDLSVDLNNAPILHAGDFFDGPRDVIALFKFLTLKENYPNTSIFSIYGQHDLYYRNKEVVTNLGILQKTNAISILNDEPYTMEYADIYGCSWGSKVPKIENKNVLNILAIHAPIYIDPLFPGHSFIKAKEFQKENKRFDLILCGDIHRHFVQKKNGRIICNTGPLMRLESSDYMMEHKPKVFVYNTEKRTMKTVIVPHKMAIEVLRKEIKINEEQKTNIGDAFNLEYENVNITGIIDDLLKKSKRGKKIRKMFSETIMNFGEFFGK